MTLMLTSSWQPLTPIANSYFVQISNFRVRVRRLRKCSKRIRNNDNNSNGNEAKTIDRVFLKGAPSFFVVVVLRTGKQMV